MKTELLGEYNFDNGRKYLVSDTHKPYVDGEYPSGGYLVKTWSNTCNEWVFSSYAADEETLRYYLNGLKRLSPQN